MQTDEMCRDEMWFSELVQIGDTSTAFEAADSNDLFSELQPDET